MTLAMAPLILPTVAYAGDLPPTALMGDGKEIPLKNAAMITKTKYGYRYRAGQQDSHLVVTQPVGRIRFVDTGTRKLRHLPSSCHRLRVRGGIGASCPMPARYDRRHPMFLEVWPRLGNDYIDGSTLSRAIRLWALADAGSDRVYGGAGDDFVNGAQGNDRAHGGAGNDWIRTGIGRDRLWGGGGKDRLVGVDGADQVHGGPGRDRVEGGHGNDRLWGDIGRDRVMCGIGIDGAWIDSADRASGCESTRRTVTD
jgi:hypothetical protein